VRAKGTPPFFFSFAWKKKKPTTNFKLLLLRKKEKAERERERKRGEVKQREEKVSRVSHNSLPSVCVSAVVLKSNKAL
jgi:hypothetical protein